ncbi:MAG: YlxR family protein [Actinomycetota bacterium]
MDDGPVRTCAGCRRRRPQAEMLRIARLPDGTIEAGGRGAGRGAYLCPGIRCIDAGLKGGLKRTLKTGSLPDGLRETLVHMIGSTGDDGRSAGGVTKGNDGEAKGS